MPVCQRVFGADSSEDGFSVTDLVDEQVIADLGMRLCGKPAFYKQVSEAGNIVIWICVDCFNEFEAKFGDGTWGDVNKFDDEFDIGEDE